MGVSSGESSGGVGLLSKRLDASLARVGHSHFATNRGKSYRVLARSDQGAAPYARFWAEDLVAPEVDLATYLDADPAVGDDDNSGSEDAPIHTIAALREMQYPGWAGKNRVYFAPGSYPWPEDLYWFNLGAPTGNGEMQVWFGGFDVVATLTLDAGSTETELVPTTAIEADEFEGCVLEVLDGAAAGRRVLVTVNETALIEVQAALFGIAPGDTVRLLRPNVEIVVDADSASEGIIFNGLYGISSELALVGIRFVLAPGKTLNFHFCHAHLDRVEVEYPGAGGQMAVHEGSRVEIRSPPVDDLFDDLNACGLYIHASNADLTEELPGASLYTVQNAKLTGKVVARNTYVLSTGPFCLLDLDTYYGHASPLFFNGGEGGIAGSFEVTAAVRAQPASAFYFFHGSPAEVRSTDACILAVNRCHLPGLFGIVFLDNAIDCIAIRDHSTADCGFLLGDASYGNTAAGLRCAEHATALFFGPVEVAGTGGQGKLSYGAFETDVPWADLLLAPKQAISDEHFNLIAIPDPP